MEEVGVRQKVLRDIENDVEEYYNLKRQMDEIKKRMAELRDIILENYEDGTHIEGDYVVSVKTYRQSRFDTRAFRKDHEDLYREYCIEREVKKLDVRLRIGGI